ncbi:MAG: Asp-tRNA(Asn)/Glu-tRNA(Gln) amidotransferase subunit GatC [Candidatus Diapherotrites archaeon]
MPNVKVDAELLEKVAKLARLNLSEREKKEFLPQFGEILKSFSKLDEVDVEGISPAFQPLPVQNVFREDKAENCLSVEEALSNTKNKKDSYFKGPKAIE